MPTIQIAASGLSAVPEPTAAGLLFIASIALLGRRARCRSRAAISDFPRDDSRFRLGTEVTFPSV